MDRKTPTAVISRVLYLSYNGLLDPLGQSQVLQYLVGLAARGHAISLVTFEKSDEWANAPLRASTKQLTRDSGIRWIPLTYHRRPAGLATMWDIVAAFAVSLYLLTRYRIDIVHARGYITAITAATLKKVTGVKFIFDPRSFWPDERVEMGLWKTQSRGYRVAKRLERWFLTTADTVISLTESGAAAMQAYPYLRGRGQEFSVITTCTNLSIFRPRPSNTRSESLADVFVLGYLGTVGNPYLFDEVLVAFICLRESLPDARLLVVNRRDHAYIRSRIEACGVPESAVELKSVDYGTVVQELWRMSAGVVFIEPTPSRASCAPTKLGEFLGAGVPCIGNAGVGDVERILEGENVGVVVRDFTPETLKDGLHRLMTLRADPSVSRRCADAANRHFSLEDGVVKFDRVYRRLAGQQ